MKTPLTQTLRPFAASTLIAALTSACALGAEPAPADEPTETGRDTSELFGLGSPTCPTAKDFGPGESPSRWYWRTRREVSVDVFASDGLEVAGVEHVYEVMKSWDPLNGRGITTRRPCHRAFVQRLDGSGRRFVDTKLVLGDARVTAYMLPRGYATLEVTPQDAKGTTDQVRVDVVSGARRVLASPASGACAAIGRGAR